MARRNLARVLHHGSGSAQLTERNVNYPMGHDFSAEFQKQHAEDYILRGNVGADGPVRQAALSNLAPEPGCLRYSRIKPFRPAQATKATPAYPDSTATSQI